MTQPSSDIPPIPVDSVWLPRSMSTLAPDIDYSFWVVYYVSIGFFVIVVGAMTYFAFKYRRKSDNDRTSPIDHNFKLEMAWSILPTLLLIWFFWIGFKGYANASVAPGDAMEVQVTAEMYMWTFTYPDGTVTVNELGVPKGKPVKLVMSSKDVLHSFFVSNFRVKADVVPGRYSTLWFEATETGVVPIQCAEYCGNGHSRMMGTVSVMDDADYAKWMENGGMMEDLPPAELGEKLFKTRSCVNCHSLDGTRIQGPSLKGLFGRQEEMSDGTTVTADENYIRESLLEPQKQIVKGYPGVMPTYKGVLKDKHVDAIIAFLKTQK